MTRVAASSLLRERAAVLPAEGAAILGVLNVTPDSFSDGGSYLDFERAVTYGTRLVAEGADFLDVGGESTRPGATAVSLDEELRRVVPVIRALRKEVEIPISIDTTKAAVAEAAIDAGATIVNDVSGGRADRRMLPLVARTGASVILMHRKGSPATMQRKPSYRDVVREVSDFLVRRVAAARALGIPRASIAIDPGIGFGKTPAHNWQLLAGVRALARLGFPVVIGVSRKAFLGKLLDVPASERVEATVAASLLAVERGARIVRVHDVLPMARALRVAKEVWSHE